MSITPTQELESLGVLAERFQQPVAALERALRRRGIEPAVLLNGIAFYDAEATDALRDELRRTDEGDPR